ncbi:dihydroorotate dehydrogenase B (NAD(+)), catalytic subunit [Methanobrevibacter cuticularis]|uniref:Dihydroorotate dehydrogenase n=1 Tax=Methanobrevibacter cuticularis TaxID=47311 RepID=A0A166FGY4_9EURY|nr:dihydroorotate dehydrogenase [Methanobrevibacter cuticularis]KZX17661.1 dihydroorotate dehydrogenase B (NAD(+)), catalytic subunit [Methanobrevibacter cuticularis]
MLKTRISGIEFENPLILAAGIMGSTAASMNWILDSGASGVVTKSFSKEPNKGYKNPTTVEVEGGIINAIGLSNPGVSNFKNELKLIKRNRKGTTQENGDKGIDSKIAIGKEISDKIAIASVYGSTPEEFADVVLEVHDLVDMIELNISCPHAMGGCGAAIGQDPNLTYEVVKAAKKLSHVPIIAKLTPNVTDIVEIANSAKNAGADALTLINSLGPGMKIEINTGIPILSNKFGGMSGPAIKPIAVKCVFDVYESCDIPIIGVGGIRDYKDVVEFLYAGSSAVEIGTSIMYEGPKIFSNINNELKNFMVENNFNSIDEIIGFAHKD